MQSDVSKSPLLSSPVPRIYSQSPLARAQKSFMQILKEKKQEFENKIDYEMIWLKELNHEITKASDQGKAFASLPSTPTAANKRKRVLEQKRFSPLPTRGASSKPGSKISDILPNSPSTPRGGSHLLQNQRGSKGGSIIKALFSDASITNTDLGQTDKENSSPRNQGAKVQSTTKDTDGSSLKGIRVDNGETTQPSLIPSEVAFIRRKLSPMEKERLRQVRDRWMKGDNGAVGHQHQPGASSLSQYANGNDKPQSLCAVNEKLQQHLEQKQNGDNDEVHEVLITEDNESVIVTMNGGKGSPGVIEEDKEQRYRFLELRRNTRTFSLADNTSEIEQEANGTLRHCIIIVLVMSLIEGSGAVHR